MKFSDSTVNKAWERQNKRCALCGDQLERTDWDAHHINGDDTDTRLVNCALVHRMRSKNCHHEAHDRYWAGDYVLRRKCLKYLTG